MCRSLVHGFNILFYELQNLSICVCTGSQICGLEWSTQINTGPSNFLLSNYKLEKQ